MPAPAPVQWLPLQGRDGRGLDLAEDTMNSLYLGIRLQCRPYGPVHFVLRVGIATRLDLPCLWRRVRGMLALCW